MFVCAKLSLHVRAQELVIYCVTIRIGVNDLQKGLVKKFVSKVSESTFSSSSRQEILIRPFIFLSAHYPASGA